MSNTKKASFLKPSEPSPWSGRKTAAEDGIQYWYQAISLGDLASLDKSVLPDIGLIGYACDAGVERNQGRVGAKAGPNSIRKRLAKLAFHYPSQTITDFGDVVCREEKTLEACQQHFADQIKELVSHQIFPIALGGGHSMAYAHFKGLIQTVKQTPKNQIGILNFDAHFDLRPLRPNANSGTPFYQILNEFPKHATYFALGIQKAVNPPELFTIAQENKVGYFTLEACQNSDFSEIIKGVMDFISKVDYLYITIDLDGFSSAIAPGVSAPSPLGLSTRFVMEVLRHCFKTNKVMGCDLAELNPSYDWEYSTANLAARLVDFIVGLQTEVKHRVPQP